MKYTNKEKVDHLAASAIEAIKKAQADGAVPILMVFANPEEGFEHAWPVSPSGLDVRKIIQYLYEAKFEELVKH